jgi:Na+/H+ antiporter NhaC
MSGWWSLLPFLIVIPLSIWTRQVLPGLFAALLVGSYLKTHSLLGGIKTMLSYLVHNLVQPNNIRIIIFLYVFAGLVSMIKYAGGIKGFVHLVSKKVKTKRSAMLLTWFSTMVTFSDPDFRIVTIAPIMKALKKRLNLSAQELGFTIEVTSNPIVGLVPLATAFVGYMVSVIHIALKHEGINQPAYAVYVKSIPFNFFSFAIILVGLYYNFFMHSKKKETEDEREENKEKHLLPKQKFAMEAAAEATLPAGKTAAHSNPNEQQGEEELRSCKDEYDENTPTKPWNFIVPLSLVLLLTLFLSWWDGHSKATSFLNAFLHTDALGAMLESLFITVVVTFAFFLAQKFPIDKILTHFVKGGNNLMSVILMLGLIWAVSAVSEDLGFSDFITRHVAGWIPHYFVAPILFLLGALISYFIGSSWGTWGLLMPLGITLAHHAGSNIYLVIGAVFASGTFGAFASPLSDNSVTLCTILDLPIMKYSRTKLVPSLIAAGISTIAFGAMSFILK